MSSFCTFVLKTVQTEKKKDFSKLKYFLQKLVSFQSSKEKSRKNHCWLHRFSKYFNFVLALLFSVTGSSWNYVLDPSLPKNFVKIGISDLKNVLVKFLSNFGHFQQFYPHKIIFWIRPWLKLMSKSTWALPKTYWYKLLFRFGHFQNHPPLKVSSGSVPGQNLCQNRQERSQKHTGTKFCSVLVIFKNVPP